MAPAALTRRVFLIGFMGAGKTTVGRALAHRLGWTFRDLDQVIEGRQGKSVDAIFADHGESAFRKMEGAALQDLLAADCGRERGGMIVALGGGAFVQPDNRVALDHAGAVTILLEAPLEELRRRCAMENKVRPLAREDKAFAELFAARQGVYRLARYRVETMNKSIDQVAAEIEMMLAAQQQLSRR
jgi:shikimate kinase